MRLWLTVVTGLALCACQPNDQTVKTVKQRLDDGEVIEFTKPGFRHGGCKPKNADWKVRLNDEDERHRVVLGSQESVINPGIYSCYRVGSRVSVDVFKKSGVSGDVEISKISWARIDSVKKALMSGKYFSSSEKFNQYLSGVKSRLEYMGEDYVTIIDFSYVKGSALDEKAILDEDKGNQEGDGYEETTKDGESLSRCKSDWIDMLVNRDFHAAILDGKLGSWFQLGERNCFKQGQPATIKEKLGEAPPIANVVIKKIKKIKLASVSESHFVLNGFDYRILKKFIDDSNAKKNEEFITIMDLEVVPKEVTP